jgi:hypothetical protein
MKGKLLVVDDYTCWLSHAYDSLKSQPGAETDSMGRKLLRVRLPLRCLLVGCLPFMVLVIRAQGMYQNYGRVLGMNKGDAVSRRWA